MFGFVSFRGVPDGRAVRSLLVTAALFGFGCARSPTLPVRSALDSEAVAPKPAPPGFELDGRPFCFAGANNYYAIFKPRPVVDDLFASARALELRVLRVWGMLDRGSLDGSVPNVDPAGGDKEGVYFQYWDPLRRAPAYNDGANGLERLDYVLAKANLEQMKLIVVLVNNWRPFGGIDQYLTWYGRSEHDAFFTAPEVRNAYKNWIEHVVTRKNHLTGKLYRDDPAVFAWELANEPRMIGGAAFDRASGWDASSLTGWAGEMSAFIKTLDPNHLVSVGDEGFLNGGTEPLYQAKDGVDHRALTALGSVDFGTFHLYPEDWGTSVAWGERWIDDHLAVARELGKPTLFEEYGSKVERAEGTTGAITAGEAERLQAYRRWNDLFLRGGGSGALAWMLAGADEPHDGKLVPRYPDYDRFTFYRDDATGRLLGDYAKRFGAAPACAPERTPAAVASPFVRVRRPVEHVAFGWVEERG